MNRYLLGIDVGTTGTKSILFSEDGTAVARAYKAYPSFEPAPGQREQNAEDLWDAVCETSRTVCSGHKNEVAAVSLSTQGGTFIPTDKSFSPVRRAVLWSDTRCAAEKLDFAEKYGENTIYEKTGWKLSPRFLPLEIRHLREAEGLRADYNLSVPSFIAAKMTGIPAVDLSNAGIEQTADISAGKHDPLLLGYAGIDEGSLAAIVPSSRPIGHLLPDAAEKMGLSEKTLLVSGAHDQYAALLGSGAFAVGDVMLGTGTAWAITALSDRPDFSKNIAQSVAAAPGTFGSLVSVSSGGVCLEWLKNKLLPVSFDELNEKCADRRACEDGLFFFPEKKKTFYGISLSHDGFDLARAVMEGVAFAAKAKLLRIAPDAAKIRFTGGASKSPLWTRLTADIFGRELILSDIPDAACLGAAVLAGTGAGVFADVAEGYARLSPPAKTVLPDKSRALTYEKAFETYLDVSSRL